MPQRINLDEQLAPERKTIDADWSKKRKTLVGAGAGVLAIAAVSAGAFLMIRSQPPRLPTTAEEAIVVLGSAKYERLDSERKLQYATESARLLRELPPEERRELMRDDKNREALRQLMNEMMDDAAKRFARGDELEFPGFGFRGPPRGERGERDGNREGRERPGGPPGDRENMTDEEREQRRAEMRERLGGRISNAIQSGNAQSTGLRGEMFKRMSKMRESGQMPQRRRGGG